MSTRASLHPSPINHNLGKQNRMSTPMINKENEQAQSGTQHGALSNEGTVQSITAFEARSCLTTTHQNEEQNAAAAMCILLRTEKRALHETPQQEFAPLNFPQHPRKKCRTSVFSSASLESLFLPSLTPKCNDQTPLPTPRFLLPRTRPTRRYATPHETLSESPCPSLIESEEWEASPTSVSSIPPRIIRF